MHLSRLVLAFVSLLVLPRGASAALNAAQVAEALKTIDARMDTPSDYQARVLLQQKSSSSETVKELIIYRRDKDDAMILLFSKPKSERGKGTLRLDDNIWFYEASAGKWSRASERDNVGGSSAKRRDFSIWGLSTDYVGKYVGEEKLGAFTAHRLELTAKKGVDVPYSRMNLWVDAKSGNPLKKQGLSDSGKLLTTTLYPKWSQLTSPSSKEVVYYPKEQYIVDEVEKGSKTTILVEEVSLAGLAANIFTKAWLESQSR